MCSTDSEPDSTGYHSSGSSGSPPESSSLSSRPPRCKTVVTCRGRHLTRPRARGQWNTVAIMTPDKFAWNHQTEERALRRNRIRHAGYVDFNQQALNRDMWPQHSFSPLISHCDASRYEDSILPTVRELPMSRILGRCIANAVETELFPARWYVLVFAGNSFFNLFVAADNQPDGLDVLCAPITHLSLTISVGRRHVALDGMKKCVLSYSLCNSIWIRTSINVGSIQLLGPLSRYSSR